MQTSRLPLRQSGLPAEVSSLVGRGPEIAAVRDRLRGGRVVTLTGPGGCGKTRLALRVAALAEAGFGDGARLVELAPLTDPALVAASVARALGVSERDALTPAAGLVRALAGRELLVVVDNCEHVLEAAAGLVATLVARCRRVRFLATSRERLDVPGELVFPVPPLGLPAGGSAAAVAGSEAGALFAARAGAASPAFELSADNAAAVARVCARLDGIPLAIELAAARCPALGAAELAARLDGHPGLLSGGPARPGRHRSLEALVAWSYELLGEAERRLLARLSVLRGGFDLGTAERVAAGGPLRPEAIAGLLASLAGKSVVRLHDGAAVRYSLLETIRQFAAGQLAASGAARLPLQYLTPGFTANRAAPAGAASQARHILGDHRFTQAWEQGQALTLDDAVAFAARKAGGRKRPATGWASLTPAEREVSLGAAAVQPGVAEVVPEPVRVGVHAALASAAGDHLVDAGGGQRLPVARAQPQLRPPRLPVPGAGAEVPVQAPRRLVAYLDDPVLAALAADGDLPLPQIDVAAPRVTGVVSQAGRLGQPDAGRLEHRDDRGIAALGERPARARLLQLR